jgi:Na+-translocating ferredoxin:NAD+ oxidoreductase RnfA subunit
LSARPSWRAFSRAVEWAARFTPLLRILTGANAKGKTMLGMFFGLNATYLAIIAFIIVVAVVVALLNSIWKPKK